MILFTSARRLLFVSLIFGVGLVAGCTRQPSPASSGAMPTADLIFSNSVVLQIKIEIPRAGLSVLRRTQWTGDGEDRPETRATVKEGDTVYRDVAVHLKGAAGSFRQVDGRPSLTLNFDKYVPGQSFHGLHKISLNNSVQDDSLLSEKLCRELFEAAGVPVPRAGHAIVQLNGRDLGMYVMLEGANKQFLKRYFKNTKGNFYDGGFVRDINESLAVNSGAHPEDRAGLKELIAAEREVRQNNSLERLSRILDVDRFISMMAMEVMICHWDGYCLNRNNWRLFHDLDSGKMTFIPHGIDQTFGTGGRMPDLPLGSIRWEGKVAAAVGRSPEGRRRYRERFGQLYTNAFNTDQILARIDQIQASIGPSLAQWNPTAARDQERAVKRFKASITRRINQLSKQLATPAAPWTFGPDGQVRLTKWSASAVHSGRPVLQQGKDPQGRQVLTISAGTAQTSSGSWRMRALLTEGRYQFVGQVRVQDVAVEADDPRGGAGLRISKGPPRPGRLNGTTDWQEFVYEFQQEDTSEVELICELRATHGEAWFDLGSLRLARLP